MDDPIKIIAEALLDEDTPFVWRRALDKSHYEVVRADNPDWREVISDERTVVFKSSSSARAEQACSQLEREWRAATIIDALARHGYLVAINVGSEPNG